MKVAFYENGINNKLQGSSNHFGTTIKKINYELFLDVQEMEKLPNTYPAQMGDNSWK